MKKYILAHDFGTNSDKIVLFSFDGSIVRNHLERYRTHIISDGGLEQDPEDWWKAFCKGKALVLQDIDPEEIACVAIDGTDPNLICIGKDRKPLCRCIMWNDARGKDEVDLWNQMSEEKGQPKIVVNSVIAKLLWMAEHHPDILEDSSMILSTNHSYLVYRLCGRAVCDTDSAIDSGMYMRNERQWNSKMMKVVNIGTAVFPEIVDPTQIVGNISEASAGECGLPAGLPLIGGLPDASAAAVGTGAHLLHNAVLSFGTSAGIMYTAENEDFGFKAGTFSNSAGATYNWALDTLIKERDHERAEAMLAESVPGANGVIFHPYLSGERSPFIEPAAKGSWIGLNPSVSCSDLLRSVVEGIVMNLSLLLEEIRDKGYTVKEMTITGGFSKSPAICQMIADIMNVRLHTLKYPDLSAAIGSAVLGGIAAGIYGDIHVVRSLLQIDRTYEPDQTNAVFYAHRLSVYKKLLNALLPIYPEL